ncbi:hypothetical protein AB0H83_21450 [Dactylosporangium sp. NPDC050688]|uniref:hypothetical protein n=1 Tax=Dactylosporangium sp. NPDC050688 TaxID=3157217 RepID=UPI0033F102BD
MFLLAALVTTGLSVAPWYASRAVDSATGARIAAARRRRRRARSHAAAAPRREAGSLLPPDVPAALALVSTGRMLPLFASAAVVR